MQQIHLTIIASLIFVLAVLINSGSVYLQKSREIYSRFGKKANNVHSLVILPFWSLFLYSLIMVNQYNADLHPATILAGATVTLSAIVMFVAAVKKIGNQALVNGDLFVPVKQITSGIYKYIKSPIYLSYTLALLGVGILFSNVSYLCLAALSVPLFFGIEDNVENSKFKRKDDR